MFRDSIARLGIVIVVAILLTACNLPTGDTPTSTPIPTATTEAPYMVEQPLPGPSCSVHQRPEMSVYGQSIYASADASSEVLGVLRYDSWIEVIQRTDGQWYQANAPGTPVNGGWIQRGGVLLEQPCSCYPGCGRFVAIGPENDITTCMMTLPAGQEFTIYYQPTATSTVFSTLSDGVEAMALARTSDGWVGFDPGVAQADNTGMDRLRWVDVGPDLIVLNGPACDALTMYDFEPVN
jgi:hypothetical protein